ncbi:MAG: hypothetical protein HON94_15690 [Methylococcales bacterium]|nr:hypothetical protein [Methylococcales bacterium]MBT7409625.1 hypothetical protein [Methylococcales bacterium]
MKKTHLNQQNGATLVIALVILFMVTLLTVNTMDIAVLETKTVNSQKDREFAFQAAEAALQHAEECLGNQSDPKVAISNCGIITHKHKPRSIKWWDKASTFEFEKSFGFKKSEYILSHQPRFSVEEIATDSDLQTKLYRITAEGRGSSENARVVLQTEFRQTYYNVVNMRGTFPMNMVMLMPDFGKALCFSNACQKYLFGWLDPPREGPVTLNVDLSGPHGVPAFGNGFFMMNMFPGNENAGDVFKDMMQLPLQMMNMMMNGMMSSMMNRMMDMMGDMMSNMGIMCGPMKSLCEPMMDMMVDIMKPMMQAMMSMPMGMMDRMMTAFNKTVMGSFMQAMMKMMGGIWTAGSNLMGDMLNLLGKNKEIRNINIKMKGAMNMVGIMDMPGDKTNLCVNNTGMMNMVMSMDMGMSGMTTTIDGVEVKIPFMPDWMVKGDECTNANCDASKIAKNKSADTYKIKMQNFSMFGLFDMGMNFVGIGDMTGDDEYIIGMSGAKGKGLRMGMDMVMTMDMFGNDSYRIFTGGSNNGLFGDMLDFGNNMDMVMVMDMTATDDDRHFGNSKNGLQPDLVCRDNSKDCDRFDIRTDMGMKIPLMSNLFPMEGYHGVWPGFGMNILGFNWSNEGRAGRVPGNPIPFNIFGMKDMWDMMWHMMPMHDSQPTPEAPKDLERCFEGPERLSWREVWE